jgi:hypothetical protein
MNTEETPLDDLMKKLESYANQAFQHQKRLIHEAEILKGKADVAHDYRIKFMDLRSELGELKKKNS